jgi:23S rRNA pseudouridine2605 synthase
MKERLQKVLARAGVASRRIAEAFVSAGRVRVNGRVVSELGSQADLALDKVEVDGRRIAEEPLLYFVLHKPRGVVSTLSDPEGRPTVKSLMIGIRARVFPVGRLDFNTSGALLLTNDGDFAHALMHPSKKVAKVYMVKVTGKMLEKDLDKWRKGITLEDGVTAPARVNFLRHEEDKTWFELTISEGRNLQVRRMGEATGFPVMRLSRISVAGVSCEGLPPGKFRVLDHEELLTLRNLTGFPKRIPKNLERVAENLPTKYQPSAARADGTRINTSETRSEPRGGRGRLGRGARAEAAAGRPERSAPRAEGGGSRPARAERGGPRAEGGASRPARAERGGPRAEGGASRPARGGASQDRVHGSRYGGGAPVRRDPRTQDDWGGGIARSGLRDDPQNRA